MALKKNEIWTPNKNPLRLVEMSEEEKKEVDGVAIIGKVRGDFFVPDGESRNIRFYPMSFWERVLENAEVQQRLKERLMFGMLGHEDKEVDEKDLQAGVVTHIVTKLYIDENGDGIGEALILGTEAGKNLLIYLKAGAQLKVSSRASGEYVEGETHNGMPIMDAGTYILETFDFVINPGFLKAHPSLVEKLNGGKDMGEQLTEALVQELKDSRTNLMNQLSVALESNEKLVKEVEAMKKGSHFSEAEMVDLLLKLDMKKGQLESLSKFLDRTKISFEELCKWISGLTKEDLDAVTALVTDNGDLPTAVDTLQSYQALDAAPEEIRKMLKDLEEVLNGYLKHGSVAELDETIEGAEKALEAYTMMGTIEELQEKLALLDQYRLIGTVEDLQLVLTTLGELQADQQADQVEESAKKLSKKYSVKLESCRNLVRRMGEEEAEKALDDLKEEPCSKDDEEPAKGEKFGSGKSLLESRMGRVKS